MAGTNTTGGMPPPMAPGGTTGQVLTKKTNASYDTEWTTPAGGGGTVTGVTASAPLASSGGTAPNLTIGGGTAGQVLTSDGGTSPTWASLPAPPTVPDASDAAPQSIGTAAAGVSADYSRADHVHDGSLGDLDDVSATAPSAGQVLTWGGAEWAPATPATVPSASSSTPQGIGTAAVGVSTDYARADHVHAGTVAALTDRTTELPWQSYTEFAHASGVAATPTRDIQTAIDATTAGPAWQVVIGPGSYGGGSLTTVTIPAGRNNISLIGPVPQDFGGTQVDLSSGRGLTIGNNVTRARVVGLQIEGMTTIDTTGAGVHRLERSQLVGGLTIGAISGTIYIVGCAVSNVSINAGFTGTVLFDRCLFTGTYTNGTLPTRVLISDCAGLATAPTTSAILNGRFQIATGLTTYYANGTALLGAPLTAINGLTPAADRIAYYTSSSAASMTAITAFGRSLIDDVDAAAARSTLGLGTAATQNSTAFQAADATLTALAGVTTAANKLAYFTGVDTAAATDITTAGREILSTATSGSAGQVLTSSGGGAPTWTTVSGGGGTISGTIAANEVAFGTGVDTVGGSANLEFNSGTNTLSLGGSAVITAATAVSNAIQTEVGKWVAKNASGETVLEVEPELYSMHISTGASLDPAPAYDTVLEAGQLSISEFTNSGRLTGTAGLNLYPNTLVLTDIDAAHLATIQTVDGAAAPAPLNLAIGELQVNGNAGTSGYVLTSNGTGSAPTWQAAGGGSGSGYAADSWDDSFSDPSGAVPTGWTAETSPVITYPAVGAGTAIQLVSTTNPARLAKTYAQLTSNTVWELRVEMRASQLGTANESALVIRDGTRRISVFPTATGITNESTTNSELPMPHVVNDWFIWTVRRSGNRIYFWEGPRLIWVYPYASLQADATNAGLVRLGTSTSASRTTQIRGFWAKFGSVNDAPPDYTFRTIYFGRP